MNIFGKNLTLTTILNVIWLIVSRFYLISARKVWEITHHDADYPSSAGSMSQLIHLTLEGSNSTPKLLLEALQIGQDQQLSIVHDAHDIYSESEESLVLRKLFDYYGSDKGSQHNYDVVYSVILSNLPENLSILEIGLGTNHKDVVSNMGYSGKPGASLRAWHEYKPLSKVFGCDIDSRVLFEEDGIRTFQLDQTRGDSWDLFKSKIEDTKFDLIVDDGLHSPSANLSTLINSQSLLSKNGVLVIEDVAERSLPIWETLRFNRGLALEIVKVKNAYLVIIKKSSNPEAKVL